MNDQSQDEAKDQKNKKLKKIIVKPIAYKNSDLSRLPENLKKIDLDKFVELVNEVIDKIDLIYLNPSEVSSLEKEKAESFSRKIIFNSPHNADYVIVNDDFENFSG